MTSTFKAISLTDYEHEALKRLPADELAYYVSGSDGEETLKENKKAAWRYRLRPRVLRDVTHVDTSSKILGHSIAFPVCVAPSACHKFAHINSEIETARGAAEAEVAMALSSVATAVNKHITMSNPDGLFFMQAYVMKNRRFQKLMLTNLKEYGFKAVVLSVDCTVLSNRRQELREALMERFASEEMQMINYLQDDPDIKRAHAEGSKAFHDYFLRQVYDSSPVDPGFIGVIKSYSKLPVIVKGFLK